MAAELHEHGTRLDRPFALATAARGRGLIRAALQDALSVFDGLGARLWSAKTTAELARIGLCRRQARES
jgi:hypothetical protein